MAMLHPPRHTPDHVTLTLAVLVTLTSEQQASVTRVVTDDSPACNNRMLDIYRMVTACGQPNLIPLPSNVDVREWAAIAHTQADLEVLQYLRYGFP